MSQSQVGVLEARCGVEGSGLVCILCVCVCERVSISNQSAVTDVLCLA